MKVLVLEKYNELVYKDVREPEISDQEVLVQVRACRICGSDVHDMGGRRNKTN
jgi:threonine dehydrogenase-like Zn-dependent dehydrogenase